jgi:hypothetical protein
MTRRYRATTFSIAFAGALAIAACSTDDGGGATVCTEVTLYRLFFDFSHFLFLLLCFFFFRIVPIEPSRLCRHPSIRTLC